MILSGLDWFNLFGGMDSHAVTSFIVVAVLFTTAAGLVFLSLIAFGVRAGLVAPAETSKVPPGTDLELMSFLGAVIFGMICIFLMVFLGLAENDLDNPLFLPVTGGPLAVGGLFFLSGVGMAFRTVRRSRATSR